MATPTRWPRIPDRDVSGSPYRAGVVHLSTSRGEVPPRLSRSPDSCSNYP